MSKKVLIISTSLRANSNSEMLANEFLRGAQDAGHETEMISLAGKTVQFCKGCLACLKVGHCVINDDAVAIAGKMGKADVICFATPIYYYEMAGQMKTLLDRANSLYGTDYTFRDIYLLTASAEAEDEASDGAVNGLNGWIACFPKSRLAGVVRGGGADAPGAVKQLSDKLEAAYQMGRKL